jgi:hypothetical protein
VKAQPSAAEILREAIERHMDAASVRDWTARDRQLYEALEWIEESA